MKSNKIAHWAAALCAIALPCILVVGCGPTPRPQAESPEAQEPELSIEEQQAEDCINNLRQIDAAKEEWAFFHRKQDGDYVGKEAVDEYIEGGGPKCPAGGTYIYGKIGELPKCSIPGHVLED